MCGCVCACGWQNHPKPETGNLKFFPVLISSLFGGTLFRKGGIETGALAEGTGNKRKVVSRSRLKVSSRLSSPSYAAKSEAPKHQVQKFCQAGHAFNGTAKV